MRPIDRPNDILKTVDLLGTVFFHPGILNHENMIKTRKYLNSRFMHDGVSTCIAFDRDKCVKATDEEAEAFLLLKKNSIHLKGKDLSD